MARKRRRSWVPNPLLLLLFPTLAAPFTPPPPVPFPTSFDIQHSLAVGLAAGGLRGLSNLVAFPLDTLTTRLEALQESPMTYYYVTMAERAKLSKRAASPFKGASAMFLETVPAVLAVYVVHDYIEACIGTQPAAIAGLEWPIALAITSVPMALLTTPIEAVKQRVQVGYSPDVLSAARAIWQEHGIRGFYWAYLAMLPRDLYTSLIQSCAAALLTLLASEELVLTAQADTLPDRLDMIVSTSIAFGTAAFAAICTQPLDVIKTRLATTIRRDVSARFFGTAADVFEEDTSSTPENPMRMMSLGLGPRVAAMSISSALFDLAEQLLLDTK